MCIYEILHITMCLLMPESAGLTGSLHRGIMKLICLTLAACVATAMAAMAPAPAPIGAEALVSYTDVANLLLIQMTQTKHTVYRVV